VEWAWRETPPVHKDSKNLLIHIVAVPLFVAGHVLLVVATIYSWWLAVVALAVVAVSIALQGIGHSMENQQVPAFTGPRDFVRRLYAEQFFNFWRFVVSGQWYTHLVSNKNQWKL
jgi:uncharacterized membrane protein YGL010W